MSSSSLRTIIASLILACLSIALAGCSGSGGGAKLDGVYHAASGGPMTLTIRGDKAEMQIAGESQTFDYKIEGNKLTILNPQEGDIEFTINDDGTLSGQLGLMTKTP
jgi:hypothetical protein